MKDGQLHHLMIKPSEEAGVTLKVSHAELNLNRLTKQDSNEGGEGIA